MVSLSTFVLVVAYSLRVAATELRPCGYEDLAPCMLAAVKSYEQRTRPDQYDPDSPPTSEDTLLVQQALGTDVSSPTTDLPSQCKILEKLDYQGYLDCNVQATEECWLEDASEEFFPDLIPSIRTMSFKDLAKIGGQICLDTGCKNDLVSKMAHMVVCWKSAKMALNDAATQNYELLTTETCSKLGDYMKCQWTRSVGCHLLEIATRLHLISMIDIIAECKIDIPQEALRDPRNTPTFAQGSRSTAVTHGLTMSLHSTFAVLMVVHVIASF